jgi:hypothetical protein
VEGRERVIRIRITRVNGQPEELAGPDGRRQPSMGGTSRVSREAQARICERLGVQSPGPTRHTLLFAMEYRALQQPGSRPKRSRKETVPILAALGRCAGRFAQSSGRTGLWCGQRNTLRARRSRARCLPHRSRLVIPVKRPRLHGVGSVVRWRWVELHRDSFACTQP